jgi:hypothetical protein
MAESVCPLSATSGHYFRTSANFGNRSLIKGGKTGSLYFLDPVRRAKVPIRKSMIFLHFLTIDQR